ncbi:hypothetical protein IAT38_005766 [Cryptococcus sp. DSM 104549]
MITPPALAGTVTLAAFLGVTTAQTYIGCATKATVASWTYSFGPFQSVSSCQRLCAFNSNQYRYSAVVLAANADSQTCYCTDGEPPISGSGYTASTSASGDCATGSAPVTDLTTDYTFSSCLSALSTDATDLGVVSSVSECFTSCNANTFAIVSPISSGFSCFCGDNAPSGTSSTCDLNAYFVYSHTADPSASQLRRRKVKEARAVEMRKREENQFCPEGLTACLVGPGETAYECMDTKVELESCGGCTYGVWGNTTLNVPSPVGIDCSALPGVSLSGSTCQDSHCTIIACDDDWALQDGACVPRPTLISQHSS